MPGLRRFPVATSASADSLARARADVLAELDEGSTCPCCGQFVRRYKRKLNADMARALVLIVRVYETHGDEWVDVRDIDVRGGDYAKLRHWALLEHRPNDDSTKRTSGFWRPTDAGIDFAHGRCSMPSHYLTYNNEVQGFTETRLTIEEALGEGFDYVELMAS